MTVQANGPVIGCVYPAGIQSLWSCIAVGMAVGITRWTAKAVAAIIGAPGLGRCTSSAGSERAITNGRLTRNRKSRWKKNTWFLNKKSPILMIRTGLVCCAAPAAASNAEGDGPVATDGPEVVGPGARGVKVEVARDDDAVFIAP